MPGTLFLDALKKKEELRKGYPLAEGRSVKPGDGLFFPDEPNDKDLYRAPSLLGRAISRLRHAYADTAIPSTGESKQNIKNRADAEALPEGLDRDPNSIINQGVTKKKEK